MCPAPERLLELVDGQVGADEQRVIEEHIDTCELCRVALAAALKGGADDKPRGWSLGRYRVDDVIGTGGMGIVYRAWDPSLSREVAIKVVKSDNADLRARLAREAQSMARLNHRNVCQIYDVGTDDQELWIAMELVRGTTLRSWITTRSNRDDVLDVLIGAGRGLAAAHAAGLVHRDVKPENILVDRDGRAVVSDFGLARDLEDPTTRSSVLAGTPAYMALEQLEGTPADARSDQYAFAVTAHEALAGARPKPRNRASRELPPHLRAALDRALSDDPAARFPRIEQLVDAFEAPSKSRAPLFVAAAVVVLAVGGFGAWQLTRSPSPTVSASTSSPTSSPTPSPTPPSTSSPTPSPISSPTSSPTSSPAPTPETPSNPTGSANSPSKRVGVAPIKPAPSTPPAKTTSKGASTMAAATTTGVDDIGPNVQRMQAAIVAGDGAKCSAELAAIDAKALPDVYTKSMRQLRAQCLMLSGKCDEGKKADRENWTAYNLTAENVERSVDVDVSIFCRTGPRTDRDRLLRAMWVLGDSNYKHTLAECRAAFADAKQLAGKVSSTGSMDILDDAKERIPMYAPACYARAGDCPTAWQITKDLEKSDATDYQKRDAFVHAVGMLCADQDQGALSESETVWRSIVELDHVKQGGTRKPAWCTSRIDRALGLLAKLDDKYARDKLASEGANCLAVTADCATALERYAAITGGTDDTIVKQKFQGAVRECR